ncbi:MAG: SDR family NAD(P)-dependent oxidoreductase [Rhizobiales bacterium]|nr:SDR family NAD(P)-dependent oxidoreductase [Hyphomicrobiales bacterium]
MPNPLVVITGASHGIGQAVALAFAREGHPLLLMARHADKAEWLGDAPHRFAAVDVADYAALSAAIAEAEAQFGPTDCMVNNAGLLRIGDFRSRPPEELDYEIDVLFKGVVHGIRAVLPGMSERRRGTIINVSSIGDRRPGPSGETYHASKHAVRSLSESLQQAEAKNSVRVINVAPGFVKTNIHQNMGISFEEYSRLTGNPDFIAPERIADVILFCYKQPQAVCIRDIVIMPTTSAY